MGSWPFSSSPFPLFFFASLLFFFFFLPCVLSYFVYLFSYRLHFLHYPPLSHYPHYPPPHLFPYFLLHSLPLHFLLYIHVTPHLMVSLIAHYFFLPFVGFFLPKFIIILILRVLIFFL